MKVRRSFILVLGLGLVARNPAPATAASSGNGSPTDYSRLAEDVARMQQDLREQRQLIFQLMEMHSALLRYLQAGGSGAGNLPNLPAAAFPAGTVRERPASTPAEKRGEGQTEDREDSAAVRAASTGTISGSVRVKGGPLGEAFVYVDGPKVVPAHPKTIEIKQDHKQFMPALAVVQVGTRVLFPNEDKVFHNTFSRTPGNAFDLGTLKSGDTPKPVVFTTPGDVEVFCNIHSKMRADILVVPNGHWTRVHDDGTFQLAAVPLGSRRVVLWGPRLKQVSQRLEITAAGVTVTFTTETSTPAPHLNKHGGEYGSYED
jgi:plastocyanin